MSQQKCKLACHVISNLFGDDVARVAEYLIAWREADLSEIKGENVPEALAVLIQHNYVTFKKKSGALMTYCLNVDFVLDTFQHPKYLHTVKEALGDDAELIMKEILSHGRLSASGAIQNVAKLKSSSPLPSRVSDLWRIFSDLAKAHFIMRCDDESDEEPFAIPTLSVSELVSQCEGKTTEKLADAKILWRPNRSRFFTVYRDEAIVFAVKKRIDVSAGRLMRACLRLTNADWNDKVSKHIYKPDINNAVSALSQDEKLNEFYDQYIKVLEEDRTRFLDRVGDHGGGTFQINFGHIFDQLASATLDNVVLEKFGSKALRIFRVIREKKFIEESKIQGMVMIPLKEAKLLTYQLLENNFIQLQELKKSVTTNAMSKAFYLFYVDTNKVARMVLEMCFKAIDNLLVRQTNDLLHNERLLDKQKKVEEMILEIKQNPGDKSQEDLESEIQDVSELITPPEKAQIQYIESCLDKVRKASYQVEDTIFILQLYLQLQQN